jgi:X-X-X-Leu-X-X-Gly heptad repeat protein
MASVPHETPYHERRTAERRRMAPASTEVVPTEAMRVSWGGIWGGVLVAIGIVLLLAALGVAVGVTATDPASMDASTLGTGAGIWAAASLLIALFVGGMVSTRIGAIFDRTTGFFEGVLVWVVAVLLMGYLASSGIGTLAGGAFKLVGGASQAVGSIVQSGTIDLSSGNVDQILQRLKDPQTAQQVAAATGLPENEVGASLSEMAQQVQNSRDNPAQAAAAVRQGVSQLFSKARAEGTLQQKAEQIQPKVSAAAWITFGALVVSLLAAVLGAMAGRREWPSRRQSHA